MNWKIELVAIPVTDVDRAKEFYVERAGFHADHDYQVTERCGSCSSRLPVRRAQS
jgi:catechol 2,3-dioxygenase-like lactoylglutathione lyase family enzyme